MKPTDEQVKEFWERCGLKHEDGGGEKIYGWYKDGLLIKQRLPLDLNNLFKHAEEPLVKHFINTTSSEEEYRQAYYDLLCNWLKNYIWNEPHDPALALFWAIREKIHETEK